MFLVFCLLAFFFATAAAALLLSLVLICWCLLPLLQVLLPGCLSVSVVVAATTVILLFQMLCVLLLVCLLHLVSLLWLCQRPWKRWRVGLFWCCCLCCLFRCCLCLCFCEDFCLYCCCCSSIWLLLLILLLVLPLLQVPGLLFGASIAAGVLSCLCERFTGLNSLMVSTFEHVIAEIDDIYLAGNRWLTSHIALVCQRALFKADLAHFHAKVYQLRVLLVKIGYSPLIKGCLNSRVSFSKQILITCSTSSSREHCFSPSSIFLLVESVWFATESLS